MAARGSTSSTWQAHLAVLSVQFTYAGYHVFTKRALLGGAVNMYVFCAVRDGIALTCLALAASARAGGRRLRAARLRGGDDPPPTPAAPPPRHLMRWCAGLGFTGVFANQLFFLRGLELTSPVAAAALQPAVPVFTFLFALLLRTERLALWRRDGWLTLGGVLVCVAGSVATALLSSPLEQSALAGAARARGLACFAANTLCMALYLTGQQLVLARYPQPLRVTLLAYAFGTAMLLGALLCGAGGDVSWALPPHARGAVVYAGVVASGLNYLLLAWGNQVLGSSTVSLYLPLQPLAAALLARAALGTLIPPGVLVGGATLLAGLGAVTAGRGAARRAEERSEEKTAYLRSLEAGGGGAAGGARMVRSASARLLAGEASPRDSLEGAKGHEEAIWVSTPRSNS